MDSIPYPRYTHHRTPRVLSPDEVARMIEAAGTLQARAILMALYSTGLRRTELVRLRVEDIDTEPPYTDPYVRWCNRESGRPPTYVN
jgi:integrase/recombinase XerD